MSCFVHIWPVSPCSYVLQCPNSAAKRPPGQTYDDDDHDNDKQKQVDWRKKKGKKLTYEGTTNAKRRAKVEYGAEVVMMY